MLGSYWRHDIGDMTYWWHDLPLLVFHLWFVWLVFDDLSGNQLTQFNSENNRWNGLQAHNEAVIYVDVARRKTCSQDCSDQ